MRGQPSDRIPIDLQAMNGDRDHGFAPHFLSHWMRERWSVFTVAVAGSALAVGFFGTRFFGLPASVATGFYLSALLAGGYDVAREALPALFRGKFDIDLLMSAPATGAALLGKRAEGAFLLFLFSLGHAGEHYAMDRARHAVGVIPLSVAAVLHEDRTIVGVLNALRLLAWHQPALIAGPEGEASR